MNYNNRMSAISQQQACLKNLEEQQWKERKPYQTLFAKLLASTSDEEEEELLENRCVFVCAHASMSVTLLSVQVIGGAQKKEAMEECLAKDSITVAAE